MRLLKHNEPSDEEVDVPEIIPSDDELLHNAVTLNDVLAKLKVEKRVEYLEAWRKDYLERINKIIDWAVHEPDIYGDVITMLFKFEGFFNQMMMIIGQAEGMKRAYKNMQKRIKTTDIPHQEFG